MKITINLMALGAALFVWNQFLKKKDSKVMEFLNLFDQFRAKKKEFYNSLLEEAGKIAAVYVVVNRILK